MIPIIKRIHTTAFTFASLGCVLLMLLAFYWLVEVKGFRKLAFPLVVVGMNSIFIYCFDGVLYGWLDAPWACLPATSSPWASAGPIAQAVAVFAVMWYLCYWLYKRRIFVKI